MNAPSLTVPEPLADDGDDITTALETAAIFNAQGDLREAVRWVRRAAEAAGDAGNDLRALALARAVADLNIGASVVPAPAAASAPAPAPAPVAPLPAVASAPASAPDAVSSDRGSVRPSPVVRIEAAADAPPPPPPLPAAQADAPPPPPPLPAAAVAPSAAPAQPAPSAPLFTEEPDEATPIARPSWPELMGEAAARPAGNGAPAGAVPAMAKSPAASAPAPVAPASSPVVAATPGSTPAQSFAVVAPVPALVAGAPAIITTAPVPAPTVTTPAGSPVSVPQEVFKAVRASVKATGEKGVFRVTILGMSEPAHDDSVEALMVFLDPDANVLGG
jgi:hypothetical protein